MHYMALILVLLTTPRVWNDSIRDVYIDGRLERAAQTLTTSAPQMLAVVCGDDVYLLHADSNTVTKSSRNDFAFAADRTRANSARVMRTVAAGRVVRAGESTLVATLDGRTIVVAAHQSPAGPLTIEQLWETAPVWREIAKTYEPDEALVARLRAIDRPVDLEVVLATWCGDSRYHVPRLLKSIERAANPNVKVSLTGVDADFFRPIEVIRDANVTNVPTVIVRREGNEIGRVVETPAADTIEADIADIVAGAPRVHRGRIARGAQVGAGTYLHLDGRKRVEATEQFEIYERPGGGLIAHSLISRKGGVTVESWTSVDAARKPLFVEVTERSATTTRIRFRANGELWSAHSRGAAGGIIDQNVAMPAAVVTPATITWGWSRDAKEGYVVPESGVGAVAALNATVDGDAIPRSVKFADGTERRLVGSDWESQLNAK